MVFGPRNAIIPWTCAAVFPFLVTWSSVPAAEISFVRDIQPIFSEKCAACHGVDADARQGGLRVDQRQYVLLGGDSGVPALIPGKASESELFRRITSKDSNELMPPPDSHEPLTVEEVERIRVWIDGGAGYEAHWSFVPPKRRLEAIPSAVTVDTYVQERLKHEGLRPAPAASAGVLCRRIYLDLIGLPPSPEEVSKFEREGVAATVDRLMASDRFGEKWARHWMDLARYSDTNGYEKDLKREQWIWRDWVIEAFNNDLPYDEFIIHQIAGDLLPEGTQKERIATGFLRNSMLNEEGAVIPEQFRMVEMFDRMDCIGKAFLGLTTQCAQCHDHKYDPLTQEEYYGMFAFLNNTYEAKSWVYSEQQRAERQKVLNGLESIVLSTQEQIPDWSSRLAKWADETRSKLGSWETVAFYDLNSVSGLNHPVQEEDGVVLMLGHTSSDVYMIASPEMKAVTGVRLEALRHDDLPFGGPGRSSVGGWDIKELELFFREAGEEDWKALNLTNATSDYSEENRSDGEGKPASGPVEYLIDGNDQTQWKADRGRGLRNTASVAVIQFDEPVDFPKGSQLKVVMRMGAMLGCVRFSLTRDQNPVAPEMDHEAILSLSQPEYPPRQFMRRVGDHDFETFAAWMKTVPELAPQVEAMKQAWLKFPEAETTVLHLSERHSLRHRNTYQLERGNWDQPLAKVDPKVPAALHPLPSSDEAMRLQFARWLASAESPLTARVAVNRVWQQLFGAGLVETPEDFGTRSSYPEYQDLLDHLAVDFMENGWSRKALIRTLVLSRTYQQASNVSASLFERDPKNQLLARGPRFRLDAEVVRDASLVSAGLIHHEMGGPSVLPPVPENVLKYNYVVPNFWKPAEGKQRYRRGVYTFRKRSMPDPAMSSLDSPNGDFACARRLRSNTPLAALTCLNEDIFVESARALALRVLREGGTQDQDRLQRVFEICLSRGPTQTESGILLELLESQRQKIAEGWLDPRAIATGDPDQLPELPDGSSPQDAAVWTIVARVILNLDEFVNKN
ncbi:MAG: PSD1 and planctomycete cytochrome C domain-containing protein [Planctomycetota bacterium]|nr:PSD1 and planctomycete cytochrome C domain-containing protein [Planctomycetota bacterium]